MKLRKELNNVTALQRTSGHDSYSWVGRSIRRGSLNRSKRHEKLNVSSHNLFRSRSIYRFSRKYVGLAETIRGFQLILSGELDSLPEQAFYLVGNIDEATAKGYELNLEMENKFKK
ncbi:unnamed protein product [Lathyrus oleraceus]